MVSFANSGETRVTFTDYIQSAPIVWLNSREEYLPSDIATQLAHTHPVKDGKPISGIASPLTLENLDTLNDGTQDVYLASNDDVSKDPAWLKGVRPDSHGKTNGAMSCCIIVNDKGADIVDAFYCYFYAYNKGQVIFEKELGDHVGDWEHNMIRFKNGKPVALWYSQHASGEALTYSVVEKHTDGRRPLSYSAFGTHANYVSEGTHSHAIPNWNLPVGVLMDKCDRGTLWDPTLAAYIYKFRYDASAAHTPGHGSFTAYDKSHPVGWVRFMGHWGDDRLPANDPRQKGHNIGKNWKYEGGPTGPYDKELERKDIWPKGAWGAHIWKFMPWA